ncbi:MAG: recombination mediator RecR [Acidobacteria bacterium]|nr:recombination mediator RecR [Acidobacteriota bacterium]MCZ6770243.1 recombination mediator RecR [Acidobacteriota bacterium]MCZ6879092.1 recombination mediator RecR [Acidobacteriota bacterium]
MTNQDNPVQRLIEEFKKLPGIGPKSAQRLVFHLIRRPNEDCQKLAEAVSHLKANLVLCSTCNNITEVDPCRICSNSNRDPKVICVVEEPFNILSIEKTGVYNGHYHVLHGAISPIDGIGPDDLKLENLFDRLKEKIVEEVIVATNPTSQGESTALYLSKLIKPLDIKVSRIASGIPVGADLEYTDTVTLSRALSGRQEL